MKQKIFFLLYVWFSLLCLSTGLFRSNNFLPTVQTMVFDHCFDLAVSCIIRCRADVQDKDMESLDSQMEGGNRMNFICVCLGIVFIAGGILFVLEKGHIHLDAWKKMSWQEKNKIRIRPALPQYRRNYRIERISVFAERRMAGI